MRLIHFGKRSYTFIIASHADAKLLRLSLTYPALLAISFFVLIGFVTAIVGAYHCSRIILRAQDYRHLLAENDSFRAENRSFNVQTALLGEKIDFLETLAQRVALISGMNAEKSVGGVGGSSREIYAQSLPVPASTAALSSFDHYHMAVNALEDQYRRMGEFFSKKILLASAVPDRMPVKGYVSGSMGMREDPFDGSTTEHHCGLDISAPYGSPIRAPADGVVNYAGPYEGYGKLVIIDHRFGIVTRYGHLSRMIVRVGQRVSRSEVIGYVGTTGRTTGPHLHYEVLQHNVRRNPRQFFSHSN